MRAWKHRLAACAAWLLLLFAPWHLQQTVACEDSLYVAQLLQEASVLPADSNKVLFFAHRLEGRPYLAGTLETGGSEQLVVRLDGFDCFTFMESVLALMQCHRFGQSGYTDFKKHLQEIRYRNGAIESYASRLHYFSDWVFDNTRKGVVYERTAEFGKSIRRLSLDFMTSHASLYPALAHPSCLEAMREVERHWRNYAMPYLEKAALEGSPSELAVHDGDILALTTSKAGLDVVHVGFACWIKGKLHLFHASSLHGKVVLDTMTLFEYLKNKPYHIGVRVLGLYGGKK